MVGAMASTEPYLRPSLWRDRSFRLFWAGEVTSIAGSQVTLVVLPILVFQLTGGSAAQTSLLLTIEAVPYLAFGLVAGAVGDRVRRRPLMVGCDLASAVAMASIPTAAAVGVLSVAQIYTAGAVTATAFVWRDAGLFGALPAIVGRDRVVSAFGALISAEQALRVGATALGGALAAAVGPVTALWVDAVSYLVAATTLTLIPRSFGGRQRDDTGQRLVSGLRREIGTGLRYLRRHPVIWPLTVGGFGSSLTSGAVLGLLVVYGVRQLGLSDHDARLGWLFTAGGVGAVCAGLALPRLSRRVSQPRITLVAFTGMLALLVGIALATSLPAALLLLAALGGTSTLIIANGIALRQQLTPDRLQGRVNVTARMIAWGGQPIGAAIGGVLADHAGVRLTYLVMALGATASTLYLWATPLRRINVASITRLRQDAEHAN